MALKFSTFAAIITWTVFCMFMIIVSIHPNSQITNIFSDFIKQSKYGHVTPLPYNTEVHGITKNPYKDEIETLLKKNAKPLIVWDINGRLGNHMFIHATAYALAQKTNHTTTLKEKSYLLRYFPGVKAQKLSTQVVKSLPATDVHEKGAGIYTPFLVKNITMLSHVRLHGHYQSWKYFDKYKEDLKQQFKVTKRQQYLIENRLKYLVNRKLNTTSSKPSTRITFVGIHIRRGDVTQDRKVERGFGPAPIEYIKNAMNYYRNKYKNVMFIVCSNDMKWSVSNIGDLKDTFYVYGKPIQDLMTLTLCNHTIVTTGTFGWWAGWLAGGQVVYYSKYPTPGSFYGKQYEPKDYYPPDWISMS